MKRTRKKHNAAFKAKVALAAVAGQQIFGLTKANICCACGSVTDTAG